jgi:hypothetical protein
MYKAIYASAWDLVDDGWNAALERIRETGVNTITLAASQPAGPTPYPYATGAARASPPAAGTVHFRARPERYGHIKPQVHPMAREMRRPRRAAAGRARPRPGGLGGKLPRHAVGRAA